MTRRTMAAIGSWWSWVLFHVPPVLAHEGHAHSDGPRKIGGGGGASSFLDQIGGLGIAGIVGVVGILLVVALVSRR